MEFRKVVALAGPNVWTRSGALEAWVSLDGWRSVDAAGVEAFQQRLLARFPALVPAHGGNGDDASYTDGLRPARLLEQTTTQLLAMAGPGPKFGLTRATRQPHVAQVIVACQEESLGRGCLEAARQLCLAAWNDEPVDVPEVIKQLRDLYDTVCLGPSTRAIVKAANARGIPARRLVDRRSLVQLGQGSKQRRIMTAETDRTGAVAESISQDKELTKRLLRAVGVPVPEGRPVDSPADAWQAAQNIVPPVVVKPRNGNHGRGVFTNLTTRDEIDAAYAIAVQEGDGVLVERYIPGNEHRLLVVGDRVVAAARGEPAVVVGDGRQKVTELVEEQINSDPRRGEDYACPLSKIDYDSATRLLLKRQGFTVESVPPAGQTVLIQQNGNLAFDVTDRIHADVEARAVEAARAVGLDIAGIDMVIADISRPMEEQRAAVVEVNAGPGLQMHLQPSVGTPRPVGEAIVATLFADDDTGRVPVAAVMGASAQCSHHAPRDDVFTRSVKTTLSADELAARLLSHILQGVYRTVGTTLADGVYVNRRCIDSDTRSQPAGIRTVLMNPSVETAVFSLCPSRAMREGLGLEDCDVAVIVDLATIAAAGDGDDGLRLDEPSLSERTLVHCVRPQGVAVLNADDPAVAALAPHCPGQVVLFARDGAQEALAAHRARGGRVVYFADGQMTLATGAAEEHVACGALRSSIEPTLAAVAAAWSLNVPLEIIGHRVASFDSR